MEHGRQMESGMMPQENRKRSFYLLTVVIVSYNSADALPGLLDSFSEGLAGIDEVDIVIADNDSRDNSVELALAHKARPKVIRMGRNAGYSAGINAAIAASRLDSDVLILNPDIRLFPGTARLLLERLRDPKVGVAVPKILNEDGSTAWSLRREPSILTAWSDTLAGSTLAGRFGFGENICDPAFYETGRSVDWATGAILAIAARARHLVGKWDESFFLYSEEVDYQRRVREAGFSIAYVPEVQAIHIGGDYHVNTRLSALMTANRIHYFGRHHGRVATLTYRLGLAAGSGMRFTVNAGHRAAFWAALAPWKPPPETLASVGVEPKLISE